MKYIRYLAICTLFIWCGSCTTTSWVAQNTESLEPTDKRLLVENRITEQVISDPLFAAQLIEYHRQEQALFLPAELEVFRTSLEQAFSKQLSTHLQEKNFEDAAALLHSLQAINYPVPPSLSMDQILRMEVLWRLEQNNYLPLLFSANYVADYRIFSTDEVSAMLKIALRHNHRALILKIVDSVADAYPALAQQYRAELQQPTPTLTEMLEGTVTVWVDKGFTITDGVGHPDRVFGSAFFVDQRGYLITNYHVIASEVDPEYEGFSRLYIRLSDNSDLRIPAKVVGHDRLLDIALLKTEITPEFIFPLEAYQSRYISGTQTYALGSPIGLDKSITSGIISSSSRRFLPIGETLQIDAPVNPGNSGGPLVSKAGEVMGVVYAGIPQFQGINFAIPINWVWSRIPSLFSEDNNHHFWLGVAVQEVRNGLEVVYVMPNSAADESGIDAGDVLTRINGQVAQKVHVAQAEIATFRTQALIEVDWIVDGAPRTYLMKIQPRPFSPLEEALGFQRRDELFVPLFGMRVDRLGSNANSRKYVINKIYNGTIADELGFSASDPFTLRLWEIDKEQRIVRMQIDINKTQNGFTASGLQLFNRLDLPNFI